MKTKNLAVAFEKNFISFGKKNLKNADLITREAAIFTFGEIIEDTPVGDFDPSHEGTLKGAWDITKDTPSSSKRNVRDKNRNADSIRKDIPVKIVSGGRNLYMTNSEDYAGTVEYGGFLPLDPKVGTWHQTKNRFEIRSKGGFSKQAPKGMVRRNIVRFTTFLKNAANKLR